MRLGGSIAQTFESPQEWIKCHEQLGYRAAYCPVDTTADDATVREFRTAADRANLLIAEVGAWSNPIHPDSGKAQQAVQYCCERLALAERIGARCCVNITGSRSPDVWDGPHQNNFSEETFALIVDSVRKIIDAVKPQRTRYVIETMPWALPSSADEYVRLLEAVDRPALGVHLDPVNLVNSPRRAYSTSAIIRDFFDKLGPRVVSAHAKDVNLVPELTVQLVEVLPGEGLLDYSTFLHELSQLDNDTPLLIEHLHGPDEYLKAANYIRRIAHQNSIAL